LNTDRKAHLLRFFVFLAAFGCLLLFGVAAFASEGPSPGRRIWDNMMLWVNFGILVFFFLKYAKSPLMEYLHGIRRTLEADLNGIEGQIKADKSQKDAEAEKLQDIEERLAEIREGILEMGRREKEKIIEQAKISAERMVESAKVYSEHRIAMAKKALSDEMVDIAVAKVEEILKKALSDADHEKLVNQFVSELKTSKEKIDQDSL
jgi:F-type H+-transporting ATPase subunit b